MRTCSTGCRTGSIACPRPGRATTDRRTPVRDPQGLDGRHPLPDPDPRQGPNRDEPPRPGLQLQANDHDLRCGTADGGDQNLIAPLKPLATVGLPRSRPPRPGTNSASPPPLTRFPTPSGMVEMPRGQANGSFGWIALKN